MRWLTRQTARESLRGPRLSRARGERNGGGRVGRTAEQTRCQLAPAAGWALGTCCKSQREEDLRDGPDILTPAGLRRCCPAATFRRPGRGKKAVGSGRCRRRQKPADCVGGFGRRWAGRSPRPPRAKKRPPERLCPRGAKDTHFSGSDWTPLRSAGGKGGRPPSAATSAHGVSEASRLRPCKRPCASRPAGMSLRDIPSAGTATWMKKIRSPGVSRSGTPLPCGAVMRCGGYGISFFASRPVFRTSARAARGDRKARQDRSLRRAIAARSATPLRPRRRCTTLKRGTSFSPSATRSFRR